MVTPSKLSSEEIRVGLAEWIRTFKGEVMGDFNEAVDIIVDLGLDSMDGVELACDFSTRFGVEIPLKDNPLIHDDPVTGRRRSRKFGEIVDYLVKLATH